MAFFNWDEYFLAIADTAANKSKDPTTRVGAVITLDNVLISLGYNGFPRGMSDNVELLLDRDIKLDRTIHAEMNALLFARRELKGGTLYSSYPPCHRCTIHALQTGIRRFVARRPPIAGRWQDSIEKSEQYITECNGELVLI